MSLREIGVSGTMSMKLLSYFSRGATKGRMRKIIYSVSAIAVVVATIVWLKPVVIGSQVTNPSVVRTGDHPSEATATILPLELMKKHGKSLPAEYWSHPF